MLNFKSRIWTESSKLVNFTTFTLENSKLVEIKDRTSKLIQGVNFWEAKVKEKKRIVDAQNLTLNQVKLNIRSRNESFEQLNIELSQTQTQIIKKFNQINQTLAFASFGSNPFCIQFAESLEQEYKCLKNEIAQLTIPDWNQKKLLLKSSYDTERRGIESQIRNSMP
jgi:phage tail sheath protein FI